MEQALSFIFNMVASLFGLLASVPISVAGVTVSYAALIFGFFVVFMVVSVFWKGAKA